MAADIEALLHKSKLLGAAVVANCLGNQAEAARQIQLIRAKEKQPTLLKG